METMAKTSLIIKYNLWYHEQRLNKRYGTFSDWDECATLDDKDYVAILKFRAEIAKHDEQLKPEKRPGNYDVVIKTHYLEIRQWLVEGKTLSEIARYLGLNRSVLLGHVRRNHDLSVLNKIAKKKRKIEREILDKRIRKMLANGCTHKETARMLGTSEYHVQYVSRGMIKEVSNAK